MQTKLYTVTFENVGGEHEFGSLESIESFEKRFSTKRLTVKERFVPFKVFRKEYDGESIVDLSRDISECLDARFNPIVNEIPNMEGSTDFWGGKFVAQIIWVPDEEI